MDKSETIAVIRSLLSSTKNSCSVFQLNLDFKNETGVDIPLFGYASVGDFLCSIPDTVKVTGIYPIQRVSLVTSDRSAHIVSLVKRQKTAEPKKRIHKGKPAPKKFTVNNRVNGFRKRETAVEKTQSESFKRENDVIKQNGEKNTNFILTNNSTGSANALVSWKDCLGPGESIHYINIELHAQVGRYVEVHPCQIFNPHKFYFHFRKFRKKFLDFMEKLQIYYTTRDIPKVADDLIRPKLMCAIFYKVNAEPMWHRAEILEIVNDSQVMVNFIDRGDVVKIPKKNLKLLHRDFSSLPRQAYLGSLANIRAPKDSPCWSPDAVTRFFDLSFEKDLVAGVVHVNPKEFCLNVALSCTTDKEIHINDTLVKEGLAEFEKGVLDTHFVSLYKMACERDRNSKRNHKPDAYSSEKDRRLAANGIRKTAPRSATSPPETPVIYFSHNYSNINDRLKKMFVSR